MKKNIVKALVLVVIFVAAIIFIGRLNHKEEVVLTSQMEEPTYPVLYMTSETGKMNTLYGYGEPMEANYMRDTITPLPGDRKLKIEVEKFNASIKSISYEVRSLDTERLVEDSDITDYEEKGGYLQAVLNIKDLLEDGTEYILKITLQTDTKEAIHYYTRIIREDNLYTKEKLKFIREFHDLTFKKEEAKDLAIYLESDSTGDNTNFGKVTIRSSFDQVTWGELGVKKITEPIPSVKEINSSTASATLSYMVSTEDSGGDTEYYNVTEFYRVRYTETRMYLLDFERTMNQTFSYGNQVISETGINLGIAEEAPEYRTSEDGNILCFVQEGELWHYNSLTGKLVNVFSFLDNKGYDVRNNYDQHDIKIVDVDGSGNTDFIVYGYMNRGVHEGESGICIYRYNSQENAIAERLFIKSAKPYQILKEYMGNLSCVNDNGIVYLMLDNSVYEVNLESREYKIIVSGLTEGSYVVSDDNYMLAWQEEKQIHNSSSIQIRNLKSESQYKITCNEDERIMPLGFMGEDFIYGIAKQEDIIKDIAGNTIFPMYTLRIQDKNNRVVKEYTSEGIYITDAEIDHNMISLTRVTKNAGGSGYTEASNDQIMNNIVEDTGKVTYASASSEKKKKEGKMTFQEEIQGEFSKVVNSKEIVQEESKEMFLENNQEVTSKYYVYAKGVLDSIHEDIAAAITSASGKSGVVIADSQKYIWERGNRKARSQVESMEAVASDGTRGNMAVCLELILKKEGVTVDVNSLLSSGETALQILEEHIGHQVVDLTGTDLDAALYYVSQEVPVLAMLDSSPVLIVGYDEFNIIVMNPETGSSYKIGLNDSKAAFSLSGNIFITYLK